MGFLTRDELVTEALHLAGNTGLTTRANRWLEAYLTSLYASWRWPFLEKRYGPFSLTAGSSAFTIGDGTNTADKIARIGMVKIADTVNTGGKGELKLFGPDIAADVDPAWADENSRATPEYAVLEPASSNVPYRWTLSVYPIPDRAYRVIVVANRRPAALAGADIPPYPNDDTLMQGLIVRALMHQNDERAQAEYALLINMESADRVKHGAQPGINQKLNLQKTRFKR